MFKFISILTLCMLVACVSHPPLGPLPSEEPTPITYTINIPDIYTFHSLSVSYPDGIKLAPLDAQRQYDFTNVYGSPNVYYGESAPNCEYINTGIVVAPHAVAGMVSFTGHDWPNIGLDPLVTYIWLGRFAYTLPASAFQVGTFVYNPNYRCDTPK